MNRANITQNTRHCFHFEGGSISLKKYVLVLIQNFGTDPVVIKKMC